MLALSRMERRRISESWEEAKTRALAVAPAWDPPPSGTNATPTVACNRTRDGRESSSKRSSSAARNGVDAALKYLLKMAPADPSPSSRASTASELPTIAAGRPYRATPAVQPHLPRRDTLRRPVHPRLAPGPCRSRHLRRAPAGRGDAQTPQRRRFPAQRLRRLCRLRRDFRRDTRRRQQGRRRQTHLPLPRLDDELEGGALPAPANVVADLLEAYLLERIKQAYERSGAPAIATSVAHDVPKASFDDVQHELQASESELERYAADPIAAELLGETAWAAGLRTRSDRVQAARLAYREHVDTMRMPEITITSIELLDSLAPEELGSALRAVFQTVRVAEGRDPCPPASTSPFMVNRRFGVATLENTA